MNKEEMIAQLATWEQTLLAVPAQELAVKFEMAGLKNPWFTPENLAFAWKGLLDGLSDEALKTWLRELKPAGQPKRVAIIMAGNLPAVGFHDLLATLACGHQAIVKLSGQDDVLLPWMCSHLPEPLKSRVEFVQTISPKSVEAVIATGTTNTTRYFEQYFGHLPRIVRGHRTSLAVLTGNETPEHYAALAEDVFRYFGLGCRSVNHLLVPQDFDPAQMLPHWEFWVDKLQAHQKWMHNYEYRKAVLLVNLIHHWDNGAVLLTESPDLSSHISVVHLDRYENLAQVPLRLAPMADQLQCVVAEPGLVDGSVAFGQAQHPALDDYADGVDTLEFLQRL